jgi:hypothetical protein
VRHINLIFPGSFLGNCLHSYAWARGYAERHRFQLHVGDWIGRRIFQLDDPPIETNYPQVRSEFDLQDGEAEVTLRSYAMSQQAVDQFTRSQAKAWFRYHPAIEAGLGDLPFISDRMTHIRHGNYLGLDGFVAVSERSYLDAALKAGVSGLYLVNEATAHQRASGGFAGDLSALPDFYRLQQAKVLFRANSTFSWWAATLGSAERVFAPDLRGIPAGLPVVQDAPFIEGNWPATSNSHHFVTDLHLKP